MLVFSSSTVSLPVSVSMSIESQLREKLRKIEALFAGAGTEGERLAAEAALERAGTMHAFGVSFRVLMCYSLSALNTSVVLCGPLVRPDLRTPAFSFLRTSSA